MLLVLAGHGQHLHPVRGAKTDPVAAHIQPHDVAPLAEKMQRLVAGLREQQAEGARLETAIGSNLEGLSLEWIAGEYRHNLPAELHRLRRTPTTNGEVVYHFEIARISVCGIRLVARPE